MEEQNEAIRRLRPFLDRIIDAMSEAVLVINQTGVVIAANQAAADLLDLSDKATALRPLEEYDQLISSWHVGDEAFAPSELRRSLDGVTISPQVARIETLSGLERTIMFSVSPIPDENGQVVAAMLVARDVTQELRVNGFWKALGTAARGLSTELSVQPVLDSVLDQMVEALGGEIVTGVWQVEGAENRLKLMTYRGLGAGTLERLRSLAFDCPSLICRGVRTRQVQAVEDVRKQQLEELDEYLAKAEGLMCLVAAPLVSGGKLIGAIAYGMRSPQRFYQEDYEATLVVAGLFAVALDHASVYEQSQEAFRQLGAASADIREINEQLVIATLREQELAEEAEAARREVTNILERITEAFFAVDREWRITYVNKEAEMLLRHTREELIGSNLWDMFPEALTTEFYGEYQRAFSENVAVEFEAFYRPFDTWFEVHAYPSESGLSVYFRDVTLRKQAEELRTRFVDLIQSSNDAIIGEDLAGIITSWNPGATRLYGYTSNEAIGKPLSMVTPPNRLEWLTQILERVRGGERIEQFETVGIRKDGTGFDLSMTVSPLRDVTGSIIGVSTIARDVSEEKAADRLREEYVSLISHDLRAPLTIIMGQAGWLRHYLSQKIEEREAKGIESILANGRRMNAMIQDLVDSSRLEAGRAEMHLESTDLFLLLTDITERLESPEQRERIRLEAPEWVPPVRVDRDQIERVVVNLLTNALKFSAPESQVTVLIHREDHNAIVSVTDQGVGISREDLPHLFQRYSRTRPSERTEGLGLGLYISRLIVEAHGGRIWAESELGKGSTIYFTMPLA